MRIKHKEHFYLKLHAHVHMHIHHIHVFVLTTVLYKLHLSNAHKTHKRLYNYLCTFVRIDARVCILALAHATMDGSLRCKLHCIAVVHT